MDNLIKALKIFRKYGNPDFPTHCEHDILLVMIDPEKVSDEDKKELDDLGFFPWGLCFISLRMSLPARTAIGLPPAFTRKNRLS